jgi:hypothetical protein
MEPTANKNKPDEIEAQDLRLVSELQRILEARIEVEKIFADPSYVSPLATASRP